MATDDLEQTIKEADAKAASGDFLGAAFLYKDALRIARGLNDSEKITYCKQKLVESNQKATEQMQEHSVKQVVPTEEIDQIINPILDKGDLASVLKLIGVHPAFYPTFKNVKASAKKTMPATFHFASLSTISPEGHSVKGGENPEHHWLMSMYGMNQGIILQLYLLRLFQELKEKKGLNKESFIKYLKDTKIFPEDFLIIMEVGIERYFAGDYISALHIFIPQFESVFLSLSEKLGIDIVALNQTAEISTRTKVLSDRHLSSESFVKVWGEDLCKQVEFILFEPMGYKLRHRIAHGEIRAEECNLANTTLMLYLFLVLSARIERKEQ